MSAQRREPGLEPGAPVPDDFVDPELASLDDGSALSQGLLLVMVAAFAIFLGAQYTQELRYYFSPPQPLDLNEGADEPIWIGPEYLDAAGDLELPSNRYVRVAGIPERRSVSGDREFVSLVGSQLYVERARPDDGPRILRGQPRTIDRDLESARLLFEGEGRVVAFTDLPKRYRRFVEFYSDAYRLHFCGFEPSEALAAYQFRARREAEVDLRESLGREPTEEEVRDRIGPAAGCQQAYLVIEGEVPRAFWIYPVLYAGFAIILLGALYFFVRRLLAQRQA
jgi:hypothetical protein